MADTPETEATETPLGDRLEKLIADRGVLPELDGASETYPLAEADNGGPQTEARPLTEREMLERIHLQLNYLVDALSPHGRVIRAVDLVSDTYGPQGPLFGRLDHADVQAHAILGRLEDLAPQLARVDQFISDNQDMLEKAKRVMGTSDALRRAMPGGHRRTSRQ